MRYLLLLGCSDCESLEQNDQNHMTYFQNPSKVDKLNLWLKTNMCKKNSEVYIHKWGLSLNVIHHHTHRPWPTYIKYLGPEGAPTTPKQQSGSISPLPHTMCTLESQMANLVWATRKLITTPFSPPSDWIQLPCTVQNEHPAASCGAQSACQVQHIHWTCTFTKVQNKKHYGTLKLPFRDVWSAVIEVLNFTSANDCMHL